MLAAAGFVHERRLRDAAEVSDGVPRMKFPALMERWGLFAALVFLLLGVTLAYLEAGPVAGHGIVARYAFPKDRNT